MSGQGSPTVTHVLGWLALAGLLNVSPSLGSDSVKNCWAKAGPTCSLAKVRDQFELALSKLSDSSEKEAWEALCEAKEQGPAELDGGSPALQERIHVTAVVSGRAESGDQAETGSKKTDEKLAFDSFKGSRKGKTFWTWRDRWLPTKTYAPRSYQHQALPALWMLFKVCGPRGCEEGVSTETIREALDALLSRKERRKTEGCGERIDWCFELDLYACDLSNAVNTEVLWFCKSASNEKKCHELTCAAAAKLHSWCEESGEEKAEGEEPTGDSL